MLNISSNNRELVKSGVSRCKDTLDNLMTRTLISYDAQLEEAIPNQFSYDEQLEEAINIRYSNVIDLIF